MDIILWCLAWSLPPFLLFAFRKPWIRRLAIAAFAFTFLLQLVVYVDLESGNRDATLTHSAEPYLSIEGIKQSQAEIGWEQTLIALSWLAETEKISGLFDENRDERYARLFRQLATDRYGIPDPRPEKADAIFLAHRWLGSGDKSKARYNQDRAFIRNQLLAFAPGASPIYRGYPERWPADHAELWRVALEGSSDTALKAAFVRWWQSVKSADFCSEVDSLGGCMAPPRSSSIAWVLRHAHYLPVDAASLYSSWCDQYAIGLGPISAFKEYKAAHGSVEDLDSGPIVGGLAAAPSAIGMIVAAQAKDRIRFWRGYFFDACASAALSLTGGSLARANNSFLAISLRRQAVVAHRLSSQN